MADITIADVKMKMDFDSKSFIRALRSTKKQIKSMERSLDDVVSASDRVAKTGRKLGAAKATALNTARKKAEALRAELIRTGATREDIKKVVADFNRLANSLLNSKKFAKDYNRMKQNLTSSINNARQAAEKEVAVQRKVNFELQKGIRGSKKQKKETSAQTTERRRLTDSLKRYVFWKKKANATDRKRPRPRAGSKSELRLDDQDDGGVSPAGFRKNIASASVLAFGPLSGVGSRIIALTAISQRLQWTLVGVTVGVTSLVTAMGALSIKAFDDYQTSLLKIQAVLKATSYASGQTSDSVIDFANKMALSTLSNAKHMREASTAVLTFRGVAAQNFKRVIRLAQDMSAVGFGTARNAAIQLAKALVDPAQGIASLRRVGVTFTETQKQIIKLFERMGQEAANQNFILSEVEAQLGGAAQAEALNTWAGKIDEVHDRWIKLREALGQNITESIFGAGMLAVLDKINRVLEFLDKWQDPRTKEDRKIQGQLEAFPTAMERSGPKVQTRIEKNLLPDAVKQFGAADRAVKSVNDKIAQSSKVLDDLRNKLDQARADYISLAQADQEYRQGVPDREPFTQRERKRLTHTIKETRAHINEVAKELNELEEEREIKLDIRADWRSLIDGMNKIVREGFTGTHEQIVILRELAQSSLMGFLSGSKADIQYILKAWDESRKGQVSARNRDEETEAVEEDAEAGRRAARRRRAEEHRRGSELKRTLKTQRELYTAAGVNQEKLKLSEIPDIPQSELRIFEDMLTTALPSSMIQKGVMEKFRAYARNAARVYQLEVETVMLQREKAIRKAREDNEPIPELEPIDMDKYSAHPKKTSFALLGFLKKLLKSANAAQAAMQLLFDTTAAGGEKAARSIRRLERDTASFYLKQGKEVPEFSRNFLAFGQGFDDLSSALKKLERERAKHIKRIKDNPDLSAEDPWKAKDDEIAQTYEYFAEKMKEALGPEERAALLQEQKEIVAGLRKEFNKLYNMPGGRTKQQIALFNANKNFDMQRRALIDQFELEKKISEERIRLIEKESQARIRAQNLQTSRTRLTHDIPGMTQHEYMSRLSIHEGQTRRGDLEKRLGAIRSGFNEARSTIVQTIKIQGENQEEINKSTEKRNRLLKNQDELERALVNAVMAQYEYQEKIRVSAEGQLQAKRRMEGAYLDEVEARSTETGSILDGIHMSIARAANTMRTDFQIAKDFMTMAIGDIASTFSNMLLDWDGNWKETLGNMFRRFSQWISEVLIKMALVRAASFFLGAPTAPGVGATGAGSVDISSPGASAALSPWYPGKASGGHASSGTYLVGERGPELIRFNRPGTVVPNNRLGEAMNGGGSRSGGGGTSIMFQPSYTINLGPGGMGDGANSGGRGKELAKTLDRAVQAKVTEVLLQQRRPGGLLAGPQDISTPGTVY